MSGAPLLYADEVISNPKKTDIFPVKIYGS